MPIVIETQEEWIKRHGEYVRSRRSNRCEVLVFADGALVLQDGQRFEPPTEKYELLKLKAEFASAKTEKARRDFSSLREYCLNQAKFHAMGAGPMPENEAIEECHRLRGEVITLRRLEEKAERKLEKHPKSAYRHAKDITRSENRMRAADTLATLNRLTLDNID